MIWRQGRDDLVPYTMNQLEDVAFGGLAPARDSRASFKIP